MLVESGSVTSGAVAVALLLLVAGCAGVGAGGLSGQELPVGEYVVVDIDGQPDRWPSDPPEISLRVEDRGEAGFVLSWYAGCNRAGGRFDVSGNTLQPRPEAWWDDGQPSFESTAVECPQDEHAFDDELAKLFATQPGWQREGNTLVLMTDIHQMRLERQE